MSRVDGNRIRLYASFAEAVRAKRIAGKFTQKSLAEAAGMSKGAYAKIEEGVTSCPLHTVVALADALDCTLDDLVPVVIADGVAA